MTTQKESATVQLLIGAVIVAAIVIGAAAVLWIDSSGDAGNRLSESFQYDIQQYQKIDPALFRYHQVAEIPVQMRTLRAIAVGTDGQILVAGDKAIHILSPFPLGKGQGVRADGPTAGSVIKEIVLDEEPYSITVGGADHAFPGRIYIGLWDHAEVRDPDGSRIAVWPKLGIVTSLAATENDVFVADARAKTVWRFDTNGKQMGQLGGGGDASQGPRHFVVPSPCFAVAMAPDGLLRVVNPGTHRIEAYTLDGHLELSWGQPGEKQIEAFCGCCNPSYIAILSDGRIVTSEKGIPRVKVYSSTGEFEGVVVGPETLMPNPTAATETREEHRLRPAPVAADSHGRVLVLDPAARSVRVFAEKKK